MCSNFLSHHRCLPASALAERGCWEWEVRIKIRHCYRGNMHLKWYLNCLAKYYLHPLIFIANSVKERAQPYIRISLCSTQRLLLSQSMQLSLEEFKNFNFGCLINIFMVSHYASLFSLGSYHIFPRNKNPLKSFSAFNLIVHSWRLPLSWFNIFLRNQFPCGLIAFKNFILH